MFHCSGLWNESGFLLSFQGRSQLTEIFLERLGTSNYLMVSFFFKSQGDGKYANEKLEEATAGVRFIFERYADVVWVSFWGEYATLVAGVYLFVWLVLLWFGLFIGCLHLA